MTSLVDLTRILIDKTALQRTPEEIPFEYYMEMILEATEIMFIDTGRALAFDDIEKVNDEGLPYLDYDLKPDEKHYILLQAQILFYKYVQANVDDIVSYTTDALTVANADKPYGHIEETVHDLEREKRRTYYKMTRYTI